MENLNKKQQKRLERMERKEKQSAKDKGPRQTKSALTWIATFVLIIGVVWGLVILVRNGDGGSGSVVATAAEITEEDWTVGSSDAAIHLIEYSDFQCPACAAFDPIVAQIKEEYKDDLYFAYRHFPLSSIHPHAQEAAEAAEAAGLQGKFWEMHDMLFDTQPSWSPRPRVSSIFSDFAEDLELDIEKFEADKDASEARANVNADTASARAAGVNATPTFILNGNRITNPRNVEEFREVLDSVLSEELGSSPSPALPVHGPTMNSNG